MSALFRAHLRARQISLHSTFWNSYSAQLSCLVLCPARSSYCGLLELPASSLQFRNTVGLCSVSPLYIVAWKLSRQEAGAIVGLITFVSHLLGITGLHCLMSNVLKALFYSVFFSCFQWEDKSGSSYSILTPISSTRILFERMRFVFLKIHFKT